MGPIIVPIEDSDKIIVEVDVRPMSEYCCDWVFWCPRSEFVIARNGQQRVAFVRMCTSTQKHRTEERRSVRALEEEVKHNAWRLQVEELTYPQNLFNTPYRPFFRFLDVAYKVLVIGLVIFILITFSIEFWMPTFRYELQHFTKCLLIAIDQIFHPRKYC